MVLRGRTLERCARAYQPLSRRVGGVRPFSSVAYRLGERLGREGRVLETRLPSGSPITLDMRDHSHRGVFFRGSLEPATTAVFRELAGPGSVVLDIGANVGYYSLLASDLGASAIHAFEPNPVVRELFERSLPRRGITLNPTACGEETCTSELHLPDDSGNAGLATLARDRAHVKSIPVTVVTVDGYCGEHGLAPTLLKVDVEGFESSVLRGAAEVLGRHRPAILCEINDVATRELLLEEFGYRERVLATNAVFSDSLFTSS